MEEQAIVLDGNISDGYKAYGPFLDIYSAAEWAHRYLDGLNWIATLHEPKELKQ